MKKSLILSLFLAHVFMIAAQEVDSITDIRDGQTYRIVKIGNQWWMQENLNIGTRIDGDQDASDNGIIEKYCYEDNDDLCNIYGGLYQWNEMMDYDTSDSGLDAPKRGICPEGWHLPADSEWTTLIDFLGGESIAAGKLKGTGTEYWSSPNTGATNESGFTALPGDCRESNGGFYNMGFVANFWSSTEHRGDKARFRYLYFSNTEVNNFTSDKECGFSVRCVKDE
jgi:uncharacterized protein (TIGR02145 family)